MKTIDIFAEHNGNYSLDDEVFNAHQKCENGNDKMVSYWTKECGRQNTKDTSKLTGSLVSIESICEIAHSDNSEVTS